MPFLKLSLKVIFLSRDLTFKPEEHKLKTIHINGETGSSRILIGESLNSLADYLPQNNCAIITDNNVRKYYQNQFPPFPVIEIVHEFREDRWIDFYPDLNRREKEAKLDEARRCLIKWFDTEHR